MFDIDVSCKRDVWGDILGIGVSANVSVFLSSTEPILGEKVYVIDAGDRSVL